MFGADVETSWEVGTPIRWKGEFDGKSFENYHTVTYEITDAGDRTHLTLEQDNNPTNKADVESKKNWETVLNGIKEVVERG